MSQAIPCIEVIHQLWDYLDRQLSDDTAAGIREHLEACAGCRAVSEFERAFLNRVHALLDSPSSDAELRARLLSRLVEEGFRESPRT